ncbi:MAG TPA: hypothetical protein VKG92_06705 [Flavobacteriales bacterium]|nr:hypothetical protein [Flavobacteriales bacterium]
MAPHFHKHIRLPGRDYTQGAYFVTLCVWERANIFGRIVGSGTNAVMELNDAARIVDECWNTIPDHFPYARLDQTRIMPDHLPAILILTPSSSNAGVPSTQWVDPSGTPNRTHARPNGPMRGSLGAIIAAFKSETTKRVNRLRDVTGQRLWQPGYYERAIRRQGGEYGRIAQYIAENPSNWR